MRDTFVSSLVVRFNRDESAGAPYRFSDDGVGIEIDPEWARYFADNRHVLQYERTDAALDSFSEAVAKVQSVAETARA